MRVAILALLGTQKDHAEWTDGATLECDFTEVGHQIAGLDATWPTWRAITIVHIEDFPLAMQGAHRTGRHAK